MILFSLNGRVFRPPSKLALSSLSPTGAAGEKVLAAQDFSYCPPLSSLKERKESKRKKKPLALWLGRGWRSRTREKVLLETDTGRGDEGDGSDGRSQALSGRSAASWRFPARTASLRFVRTRCVRRCPERARSPLGSKMTSPRNAASLHILHSTGAFCSRAPCNLRAAGGITIVLVKYRTPSAGRQTVF
jgi:hypothetical protein